MSRRFCPSKDVDLVKGEDGVFALAADTSSFTPEELAEMAESLLGEGDVVVVGPAGLAGWLDELYRQF